MKINRTVLGDKMNRRNVRRPVGIDGSQRCNLRALQQSPDIFRRHLAIQHSTLHDDIPLQKLPNCIRSTQWLNRNFIASQLRTPKNGGNGYFRHSRGNTTRRFRWAFYLLLVRHFVVDSHEIHFKVVGQNRIEQLGRGFSPLARSRRKPAVVTLRISVSPGFG